MNGHSPSPNQIGWTSIALNSCLRIQKRFRDLQISKESCQDGFVKGTLKDSKKIGDHICEVLGTNTSKCQMNQKQYLNWWYKEIGVVKVLKPISNSLEVTFQKVGDLYVKYVWDNAEEVEEVSDNKFADSDDDIDPDDIDWQLDTIAYRL